MRLQSIKNPSDLKLDGVTFACEYHDKTLKSVTAKDVAGNVVVFTVDTYTFKALVPAPPEKKRVNVVTARVREIGTPIREEFEESYEAIQRRSELERSGVCEDVALDTADVEIPF